jgi:hypothetical protein
MDTFTGYVSTTVSPALTNFNNLTTAGTYGVGDGSSWNASYNGPTSAYPYGQLYVKTETGSTVVTQVYYKAYESNNMWIRYRTAAGTWTTWENVVF